MVEKIGDLVDAHAALAEQIEYHAGIDGSGPCSHRQPGFRGGWEHALRAAKIENFRFHDLRHTAASWMIQSGRSLREVREILGYTTLAMTQRYAHIGPKHLRTAITALDGILPEPGRNVGATELAPQNRETATAGEVLAAIR